MPRCGILILSILSLASVGLTHDFCGPVECGLQCEGGETCLQDAEVNCIMEPCCPQWSCHGGEGSAFGCPEEEPELYSHCIVQQEGLGCDYGEQECCGQISPTMHVQCSGGQWYGFHIDTPCGLGVYPPCPDDTPCPEKRPHIGAPCKEP